MEHDQLEENTINLLDLYRRLIITQQEVISLQKNQLTHREEVQKELHAMREQLQGVLDVLTQAKGGWKLLMVLGTIGATIIGVIAWLWINVFKK